MTLTPEWSNRIHRWNEALKRQFYTPAGEIALSGFLTGDHLSFEQARQHAFKPMAAGLPWGAKWEYCWFKGTVIVPASLKGKRIVFNLNQGNEGLIFINGKAVMSSSGMQPWCPLSACTRGKERFNILAEVYAGHGNVHVGNGPVPYGVAPVPECPGKQQAVKKCTYGIWFEEAYQAWIDFMTLRELRERTEDKNSLRVAEIDAALRDFTTIVDPELPHETMARTLAEGRKRLRPVLSCVNGSTSPTLFAFGHGHLDVAWLWPLAETGRKAVRTLSNQLTLAEEYPEHAFLHSAGSLFRMVRERYPEFYTRVKKAVGAGNVIPEGAWWVEADTNISGGESLIRQGIHGKRFFLEEFGVDCELLWLPDVFGYSGNLPQILRGCGIKYFSTAKIFWNYNGGETFPYNTFRWAGIDGSTVLVHLCNDYGSQTTPAQSIARWNDRVQKDGISTRLYPFGWGDGGGGPTRDHLEFLRRQKNLEGVPRIKIASPVDFFKDLEKHGVPDAVYVGELYYQCHRGTYTSQAGIKKGNRKCEFELREAELWCVAAHALKGMIFHAGVLEESWKKVLLCQFHDMIPGTSIHRVYDECEVMHNEVRAKAASLTGKALNSLVSRRENSCTVFNSLSYERKALITLPAGFKGAKLHDGRDVPVQKVNGAIMAEISIPSCGWTTLKNGPAHTIENEFSVSKQCLENSLLKILLNDRGEIISIFDKKNSREISAGPCNSLRMYKDVPSAWDAWDIESTYEFAPVVLPEKAVITVTARGPLAGALSATRKINDSLIRQEISLRRDSTRIDFRTTIDWKERHKLLKVNFPVTIHADEAIHEIQMGHIRRPNHRSRQFDHDRFEVCNHKWTALCEENRGCAVLNDCKYGVNVLGNSINLTLLKAPLSPDTTADIGKHEFTYAFYCWNGSFADCGIIEQAYDLNMPVMKTPGDGGTASLFDVTAKNIVIETVKPAEDGSSDIIVRFYESKRMATSCFLATVLPVIGCEQTDMLEKRICALKSGKDGIALEFRPFEIKTVRLILKKD